MNKTTAYAITIFSLLFLVSPGAATFGLNTFQTEAEINSTHSFRLGLINTGEEPLRVNFSANNLSRGDVEFDSREIVLPPSHVESSPQGGGWYYLDGRYIEINYQEFRYIPRSMTGGDIFSLEVLARPLNSTGPVYGPDIAQLREIKYTVNFPENSESGDGGVWSNEGYELEDMSENTLSGEDETTGQSPGSTSGKVNSTANEDEETEDDSGSVNSLTLVLLLTSLITALYIYSEV